MFDVTALGELLIDFTPCGKSPAGQNLFEQNAGGAPANVLAALCKCGKKTAFLGKVGADMHGTFLRGVLEENGIDTQGLITDEKVFTTLAFVALSETGERSFSFARKPGADTCLTPEEVADSVIDQSRIFHIGSLSLTADPARSATYRALELAKESGCVISYDPNYRAPLWDNREAAIQEMRGVLPYVNVMKLSDEETLLLTDCAAPEEAAKKLVAGGIPLVAVTLGAEGALVCTKEGTAKVAGFSSKVVDTTGAGDCVWGGFLNQLSESGKHPKDVTLEEARGFARFANACASLCVERRGAIPAMPERNEIEERMKNE